MKFQFLLFLLFIHCTNKPALDYKEPIAEPIITQNINLTTYLDSLHHLPFAPASSLHALEIFRDHFDKHDPDQNDIAFHDYLEYQATLIDTLNHQLAVRQDYEKISSLIWADASQHEPEGLQYEQQLHQYGLALKSTEGFIYIDRNTDPIRTFFFNHLSPATKEFYNQFEMETNQHLSEDGMLLILPQQLAERLAFWENFLVKYPDHLFAEFAKNNIEDYLRYLLEGMDNTPAFDFETKKLYPEFLDAYEYMNQHDPTLASTTVINAYARLLKKTNYKRTEEVSQFIGAHTHQ
jgi:hypothetical protein